MIEIIKQILIKKTPSQKDMYCLREMMRTLLTKQCALGKEERLFLDRVFANLRFLGDDIMLRDHLIREHSDELDILAERYMDKPISANSRLTFTKRHYEDVRVGNCASIYFLSRCIFHNNPTPSGDTPYWVDNDQLPTRFVDGEHSSSMHGYKELKHLSAMVYNTPLSLEIGENEKKFLYLLLSRLYLLSDPLKMRREVVKKVDFNALTKKYVKAIPDNQWSFDKKDVRLGSLGQSEALFKLGWQILRDNHGRIFN